MIHTKFDEINSGHIEALISGEIPESRTLEYKQELPKNPNDEKASNILRPAFDAIWQACGYRYSENYDENGEWQKGT